VYFSTIEKRAAERAAHLWHVFGNREYIAKFEIVKPAVMTKDRFYSVEKTHGGNRVSAVGLSPEFLAAHRDAPFLFNSNVLTL